MDKATAAKIEAFRQDVAKAGEDVVFHVFPKKILELQELIQSTSLPTSPFHPSNVAPTDVTVYPPADGISEGPAQKKRKISEGATGSQSARFSETVVSNKHLVLLHETLKRECEQMSSNIDQVKVWITLTMPNGDNFGVQVQEECLSELHRAQESSYNLRDVARQDYITRGKLSSKLLKYPNVEDYALALKEHDNKQFYFARQHIVDIRNLYASLMDLLQKNITKIRSPKANNSGALY